ncbi:KR domain-containing protein [bacterium]|nr:KR domain-containing protein [bacterium]
MATFCSSRDGVAFAVGATRLLNATRVHAVLNSLSLDFIAASFAALSEGGAFEEIGKRGIWASDRKFASALSIFYCAIALDIDLTLDPLWMRSLLGLLAARVGAGATTSLPLQSFDMRAQHELAFRTLQSGRNTGKIVLCIVDLTSGCHGTQIVTSGTGGLGLLIRRWLAQHGAQCLVLASHSGVLAADTDAESEALQASDAAASLVRCDTGEAAQVKRLVAHMPRLHGVWHAAGILRDAVLPKQDGCGFARVYAPKAHGAWSLHAAIASSQMDAFALFSSVFALLGGAGQANFSAANVCLDALGSTCRLYGVAAASVQWGAWAEVGMAARSTANALMLETEAGTGFRRISLAQGLWALSAAVQRSSPPVLGVVPVTWSRFFEEGTNVPAFLSACAPVERDSGAVSLASAAAKCGVSLEVVLDMVKRTAGSAVDADAPLMEAGVDSLSAIELRNQLQGAAGGQSLPSTLVFEHPTARQLASVLQLKEPASASATRMPIASTPIAFTGTSMAIHGLSSLLPSGVSCRRETLCVLACGRDAIMQVPALRWDTCARPVLPQPIASRVRHMGFVRGAELADNAKFAVSPAEAAAMDPCQRLVLECGYAALHYATLDRIALSGSQTGVFLGFAVTEFAQVLAALPAGGSVYAATSSTASIAAGRLSYTLGLHGPCVSYDTACSAALVASHAGLCALQLAECSVGLVVGVTLVLAPGAGTSFAVAGMTSARGRSHTFDARADGYARGEACGGVAMRCHDQCTELGVRGSAVRQDGRSASLTAPNGQAQQGLLIAALDHALSSAAALALNEAHGTGTALGDPIEVSSLTGAVLTARDVPLAVGSVKANLGHAEPAAGMTGLLKLAYGLRAGEAAPNAQLRSLNPHVGETLRGVACALQVHLAALMGVAQGKAGGGVSSFGYSGTIAHAVLRGARGDGAMPTVLPPPVYRRRAFPWSIVQILEHRELGTLRDHSESSIQWQRTLSPSDVMFLSGHQVGHVPVAPGCFYIHIARAVMNATGSPEGLAMKPKLAAFLFLDDPGHDICLYVCLQKHEGAVVVSSRADDVRTVYSTMQLAKVAHSFGTSALDIASHQAHCTRSVDHTEFYAAIGNNYQGEFRTAQHCWACPDEVLTRIEFDNMQTDPMLRGSAWCDVAGHTGVLAAQTDMLAKSCLPIEYAGRPYYGIGLGTVHLLSASSMQARMMWAHHSSSNGTSTMRVFNSGQLILQTSGARLGTFDPGWFEQRRAQILASRQRRRDGEIGKGLRPQTLCLTGKTTPAYAIDVIKQLPNRTPVLIEISSLALDADDDLEKLLSSRQESALVVLCRGEIHGGGALSILDNAIVAVGDETCTFQFGTENAMRARRRVTESNGSELRVSAKVARHRGWLDALYSVQDAPTAAEQFAARLLRHNSLVHACLSLLPARSLNAALIAMGSLYPHALRREGKRLARAFVDLTTSIGVVELNDPARYNTLSDALCEDVRAAIKVLQAHGHCHVIVLRGIGEHFCAGGNPYTAEHLPLAAAAHRLQQISKCFTDLHDVQVPIVCAAHGKVTGGGIAACMSADCLVSHAAATFNHGNLVRGVCPLADYSRRLPYAIGLSRALRFYLTDETMSARQAHSIRLVHDICWDDVGGTQDRAMSIACKVVAQTNLAVLLMNARLSKNTNHSAAEVVGHARCLEAGGSLGNKRVDPDCSKTSVLHQQFLELPPWHPKVSDTRVCTIEVPMHLTDGKAEIRWPDSAVLVFRGTEGAENFCLGDDPSRANLSRSSFLAAFGALLERLRDVPMPKIVVCHGATLGSGMVFPCLGTVVLAHEGATFGFPEIRCGALPGVVSVAAQHRLSRSACNWLFCTGDTFSAYTAKRLRLVDFTGSLAELDAESRLVEQLQLQAATSSGLFDAPPRVHERLRFEADDTSQMVRLAIPDPIDLEDTCHAVTVLMKELSSLRVIILQAKSHRPQSTESMVSSQDVVDKLAAVMRKLCNRGVVVICSLWGHITGNALILSLSAHYRIVDAHARFTCEQENRLLFATMLQTMHATDAQTWLQEGTIGATRAIELGVASEATETEQGMEERVLQFAYWLTLQPQMGMRQTLQLTCSTMQDPASLASKSESEEVLCSGHPQAHAESARAALAEPMERRAQMQSLAAAVREQLCAPSPTGFNEHLECPQQECYSVKPRNAGLHALEVYVPRHCVSAADLERAHHVEDKYTVGLMMRECSACDEDEDIVSMGLTVLRRLIERHGVRHSDVGMLQVSSESLLDRSKSIKSHLMALFEPHGCTNIEGVDNYHACYGGTAALFACTNWVESLAWDGRWAVVVSTDVSDAPKQYLFMNGAAAVAMLVGADAPLALEGKRVSHIVHEWDFYKPVGWPVMGPILDGPGSIQVYFKCLAACQRELQVKEGELFVEAHDFLVFHLGSGPKFVFHAFGHAIDAAYGEDVIGKCEIDRRFKRLVEPSLQLASRIGPMHSAAAYVNLTSLLLHATPAIGSRIGVFSYGSGAASSMYHLRVRGDVRTDLAMPEWLEARERLQPSEFTAVCERFSKTYGRFDWVPRVRGVQQVGCYCVKAVDVLGRRHYEYAVCPISAACELPTPAVVRVMHDVTCTSACNAGLHALEVYVPRHCVSAADLERAHHVEDKYTVGLMMRECSACDEDEDIVSMGLTVLRRLIERHGVRHSDVGMLQVSSESLLDRSKSIKSHLMALFEPHGCTNIEGVDNYHACYGGTAALFACTNWVESLAWDGRWAVVVSTDVSDAPKQYLFMNGAAAVAMLVGADAPLALEGKRVSHIVHEWDFYKPVGWPVMGPILDGPGSIQVYFKCLAACQRELQVKEGELFVEAHDFLVFHLGSGPKFVFHAFGHAIDAAYGEDVIGKCEIDRRFKRLVEPSLQLASRIGPMHSAAAYVNLTSLLLHATPAIGSRIGVFSYGSGAASSMYHLRVRGDVRTDLAMPEWLEARERLQPSEFTAVCERFSKTYGRFDWVPRVRGVQPARSYRVMKVGVLGKRDYEYVSLTEVKLDATVPHGAQPTRTTVMPSASAADALVTLQQLLASVGACATGGSPRAPADPAVDMWPVVESTAREVIGKTVDADAPLMEAGLDSLGATELRSRLASRLHDADLPETLVFDFPTLRQIEAHVSLRAAPAQSGGGVASAADALVTLQQLLASVGACATGGSPRAPADPAVDTCETVAALGMRPSYRVPRGACIHYAFVCTADLFTQVPMSRWDAAAITGIAANNRLRARHGGFMICVELFDNAKFATSLVEAHYMDPQQRLILEHCYDALHGAPLAKHTFSGAPVGMMLGAACSSMDFIDFLKHSPAAGGPYILTGFSHSVASGRVSYALGLHGPCVSYDTGCSSSLTALHAAWQALQMNDVTHSLSSGVNLMLLPTNSVLFAVGGMISLIGRCNTFDARADGYARSEACCAVVVAMACDAIVSVRGSAVRQDGKSASLTAPNGNAQQTLLRITRARSGSHDERRHLVEAHGTGTKLGDPIEVRALAEASAVACSFSLSSSKANAGHSEPSAGIVGVATLQFRLRSLAAYANAQLRLLNSYVGSAVTRCKFVFGTSATCNPFTLGGVSSFGYQGTIAHAVLRCKVVDGRTGWTMLVYKRCSFLWGDVPQPQEDTSIDFQPMSGAFEVDLAHAGSIANLTIRNQQISPRAPIHNEAVIDVQATGLSFRDVLNVLGLDPTGLVLPIGAETACVVLTVGPACGHVQPSECAHGIVPGSLCSRARCDARYIRYMTRSDSNTGDHGRHVEECLTSWNASTLVQCAQYYAWSAYL